MDADRFGEMESRLARLELTLLEVVTALGMLVGELALCKDLALSKPEVVEQALENGWDTLFGAKLDQSFPSPVEPGLGETRYEIAPELADRARLSAEAAGGNPEQSAARMAARPEL